MTMLYVILCIISSSFVNKNNFKLNPGPELIPHEKPGENVHMDHLKEKLIEFGYIMNFLNISKKKKKIRATLFFTRLNGRKKVHDVEFEIMDENFRIY